MKMFVTLLALCIATNLWAQQVNSIWQFSDFGAKAGETGLKSADLDGNGTEELIFTGDERNAIYILEFTPGQEGYQKKEFACFDNFIRSFALADSDGDGDAEIFVINNSGTVFLVDYEGGASSEQVIGATSILQPGAIAAGDTDNDGILEIAVGPSSGFSSTGTFSIYELANNSLSWQAQKPIVDVAQIEMVDLDGDGFLEIIQTSEVSGNPSHVFDGRDFSELWRHPYPFGKFDIADLDGDGAREIVSSWDEKVFIFNAVEHTLLDEFDIDENYPYGLKVADLDGNGSQELLIGGWDKILYCFDPLSGQLIWEIENPGYVYNIEVGNYGQEPGIKIVFGFGAYASGIRIVDPSSLEVEYQSRDLYTQINLALEDIDADGIKEIVQLANEVDEQNRLALNMRIFSATSHLLEFEALLDTLEVSGYRTFVLGKTRLTTEVDLITHTQSHLKIFRATTGELLWQQQTGQLSSVQVADLDQDGIAEVLVLPRYDTLLKVYRYEGPGYAESSYSTGILLTERNNLRAGNCDADPQPEILFDDEGTIRAYDGVSFELEWVSHIPGNFYIGNIVIADLGLDGNMKAVAFSSPGRLFVLDGQTGAVERETPFFKNYNNTAMAVGNLLGDALPEILMTDGCQLSVRSAETLEELASFEVSAFLPRDAIISDVDNDQRSDLFLSTPTGVYHYEFVDEVNTIPRNGEHGHATFTSYPNPTTGQVFFDFPAVLLNQDFTIEVFAADGTLLLKEKGMLNRNYSLSLERLPPGYYLARIRGSAFSQTLALLKQ